MGEMKIIKNILGHKKEMEQKFKKQQESFHINEWKKWIKWGIFKSQTQLKNLFFVLPVNTHSNKIENGWSAANDIQSNVKITNNLG